MVKDGGCEIKERGLIYQENVLFGAHRTLSIATHNDKLKLKETANQWDRVKPGVHWGRMKVGLRPVAERVQVAKINWV